MKKILTLILLSLLYNISYSQNDSTAIETYTSFLGYQYVQSDSVVVMPIEMLEIFENHPAAFSKMKQARSKRLVSQIFFSAGSVAVGLAIVSYVTQQKNVWEIASVGGGLILIGIPFNRSFHKHTQAATAIFNETLSSKPSAYLQLNFDGTGLGFAFKF